MKYRVIQNDEVIYESYDREDCVEFIEYESLLNCNVVEFIPCRSCEEQEGDMRYDFYGIATGNYCDECYDNDYPYRKDRYPTIEFDGDGERLNEY